MKSTEGAMRRSVSPCLLVESIEAELEFLKTVFNVTVYEGLRPEGTTWPVEAKLGDTTLKIGRAESNPSPTSSVLYVWTQDLDGTFARAMSAGATLISEPRQQPGGVREAGFRDPQGQIWWIGDPGKKKSNREVQEMLAKQRRARL
ncbi:MAG TPA: VOC family protein [Anaerolineales bacterium]|nr:VOC family protein [Anaerolineales bacterium]